jgi:hypothetical protein
LKGEQLLLEASRGDRKPTIGNLLSLLEKSQDMIVQKGIREIKSLIIPTPDSVPIVNPTIYSVL